MMYERKMHKGRKFYCAALHLSSSQGFNQWIMELTADNGNDITYMWNLKGPN